MLLLKSIGKYAGISQRGKWKREVRLQRPEKSLVSSEANNEYYATSLRNINNIGAKCFLKSNNNIIKLLNLYVTTIIINQLLHNTSYKLLTHPRIHMFDKVNSRLNEFYRTKAKGVCQSI